jgi:hypothetical protein
MASLSAVLLACLRKLRVAATRTYEQACRALLELTLLLGSDAAARAGPA